MYYATTSTAILKRFSLDIASSVVIALGLLATASLRAAAPRILVVHVSSQPTIVGESELMTAIETEFSRTGNFTVLSAGDHPDHVPFPGDRYDIDSLMNWGAEFGGRYLMYVDLQREELIRKKGFNIPLIIHKYETVGIMQGEVRLFDLQRGRILLAKSFEVETKGPKILQGYVDDNRYDADISIPAPQKSAFFHEMEANTACYLREQIKKMTNGR